MGIYDREYIRSETGGSNLFGGVSPVCKTIILINCAVFLLLQGAGGTEPPFVRDWLEASPESIFQHGRIWQLWTATFLHANIWHILGNMWFLWLVGREMEQLYGSRDFLAFYLIAAGVSTLGWAAIQTMTSSDVHMMGASGAVMAAVTLYTLYYPRREILFLFVPMPMWALLGIYLFLPLLTPQPRVAYEAHLIGAAFAFLYKQFDLRWTRLVSGRFRRPRLRIFSPVPFDQSRSRAPSSS